MIDRIAEYEQREAEKRKRHLQLMAYLRWVRNQGPFAIEPCIGWQKKDPLYNWGDEQT